MRENCRPTLFIHCCRLSYCPPLLSPILLPFTVVAYPIALPSITCAAACCTCTQREPLTEVNQSSDGCCACHSPLQVYFCTVGLADFYLGTFPLMHAHLSWLAYFLLFPFLYYCNFTAGFSSSPISGSSLQPPGGLVYRECHTRRTTRAQTTAAPRSVQCWKGG